MARKDKLLERFKSKPSDFTWLELVRMLQGFGYEERDGRGSRKKFVAEGLPTIYLHEPHPRNIVKQYVLKQVAETLRNEGLI